MNNSGFIDKIRGFEQTSRNMKLNDHEEFVKKDWGNSTEFFQ